MAMSQRVVRTTSERTHPRDWQKPGEEPHPFQRTSINSAQQAVSRKEAGDWECGPMREDGHMGPNLPAECGCGSGDLAHRAAVLPLPGSRIMRGGIPNRL